MRLLNLAAALLFTFPTAAHGQADETLDIYMIDTEGGQATLFVAPGGESVLVDAGNPGSRDVERILAVLREAEVERIDHLLITHFHGDHHGGVLELAERIPIGHFVDHGPSVETNPTAAAFRERYASLLRSTRHTVVRPGDRLDIPGVQWEIVSAAGAVLDAPRARAGAGEPNPACPADRPDPRLDDENSQSTGSLIEFGEFRVIDLGDLLIAQELALVCPVNRLGRVDLYITSHHGLATSGSAALVHAIGPRVAVMNNGTRKGGSVDAFRVLHESPGLEDLWQLHWSHNAGIDLNAPGLFIANVDAPEVIAEVLTGAEQRAPAHDGEAHHVKISARRDGSFTVLNSRNGFSRAYGPR